MDGVKAPLPDENRLTPVLKAKWVAALRGGDYVQGQGELCSSEDTPEFCCLGVLAHVNGVSTEILCGQQTLDEIDMDLLGPWGSLDDPHNDPARPETQTTIQRKLASMNDSSKSFAEIADWIEANL